MGRGHEYSGEKFVSRMQRQLTATAHLENGRFVQVLSISGEKISMKFVTDFLNKSFFWDDFFKGGFEDRSGELVVDITYGSVPVGVNSNAWEVVARVQR